MTKEPNFPKLRALSVVAASMAALALPQHALASSGSIEQAVKDGKASLSVRARYESVDQANALKDADALTVRFRLGYGTAEYKNFSAFVEAEHVTALGSESFNSTLNGKTGFSTVADPDVTEINQAYLTYSGLDKTVMKYGRQRIKLDNDRFIGNVGWRQNEQTYDGFSLVNKGLPDTTITAAYITNVNRIFSDNSAAGNFPMSSVLVNAKYDGLDWGSVVVYSYALDFEAAPANSTHSMGVRFTGAKELDAVKLLYTAEYANQSDYDQNPANFSLSYYRIEAGLGYAGVTVKLGQESLEGDGVNAFQTPLATLHAMNGWTDQFLTTPGTGLEDSFISVSTQLMGAKLALIYHDFKADVGGADYGSEIDVLVAKKLSKTYSVGIKYGSYDADTRGVDTDKLWIWGEAKF